VHTYSNCAVVQQCMAGSNTHLGLQGAVRQRQLALPCPGPGQCIYHSSLISTAASSHQSVMSSPFDAAGGAVQEGIVTVTLSAGSRLLDALGASL